MAPRFTYATRCDVDKPKKKAIDACAPQFIAELLEYAVPGRPIMILALGPTVLRALGFKVKRYSELHGKLMETIIEGRRVIVYPSLTKRQVMAKSGFIDILKTHMLLFFEHVYTVANGFTLETEISIASLTKNYVYPQSAAAVGELVDFIIEYTKEGHSAKEHSISIDTETNTLFPHRAKLKMLSIVCAWDDGHACSIPYEHPDSKWKPEDVHGHIARLLRCDKPKIGHNFKYDLKVLERKGFYVNNIGWDTMLAEHLLSEDKKGFYGLKEITTTALPAYAGYEDKLHDILVEKEAEIAREKRDSSPPKLKGAAKKLSEDDGFSLIPFDELNEYGAIDADVTRQLARLQHDRMYAEDISISNKRLKYKGSQWRGVGDNPCAHGNPTGRLMSGRVIPSTRSLARMELHGIRVDHKYINELALEMDESIRHHSILLNTYIPHDLFEGEFNPNSTAHLRRILYGIGYVNPETKETVCYTGKVEPRLTDTGVPTMDKNFLRSLVTQHECAFSKEILEYRAISKARGTFIENIRALSEEDGRMHTSFHINGTSTGRLSSSGENMQNIPFAIGKHNIKKCFIPTDPENQVLINADAKAAEVRVYAAYSKDANLIEALNQGLDPHSYFASIVYNPENVLEDVPKELHKETMTTVGIDENHAWSYENFQQRDSMSGSDADYGKRLDKLRKNIKRVVFGILYGASPFKISSIVGISDDQAAAIINTLFKMFPTIKSYIRMTKDQVRYLGVVETFFGRRRRFTLPRSMPFIQKSRAERQAVNFKIQSTSSDIVLGVLNAMNKTLESDLGGRMLITVHDSVVFELPKKYVHEVPALIQEYGSTQVENRYGWLPVPFVWDIEAGPSYGELQTIDKYLAENTVPQETPNDYLELAIRQELSDPTYGGKKD